MSVKAEDKFIGRHVNIVKSNVPIKLRGEIVNREVIKLNDPSFEQEVNAFAGLHRIWTPGSIGTMDIQPNRFNVQVDENGVVSKVWWG